ncbi:MAG: hypothetical protein AABY31_03970 [Thermoproteota archaeon]
MTYREAERRLSTLTIAIITLFGIMMFLSANAYASFGDVTLTSPKSVGLDGKELVTIHVDKPVGFSSTLTNHGKSEQKFTYIVQILNEDGGTDYLEGLSASLLPTQSFTASQSWFPIESGRYVVQVFVWESLGSAIPLTPVIQTEITVQ